jgi:hypothetical protein
MIPKIIVKQAAAKPLIVRNWKWPGDGDGMEMGWRWRW